MTKSPNYEMIKGYYLDGRWDITRLQNVVGKAAGITQKEFEEITEGGYSHGDT